MKSRSIWLATALGLLVCALLVRVVPVAADDKADPKQEMKLFEGKWKIWRSTQDGRIDAGSGDGMLIEGNDIQFLWGGNNKGATAKFSVDPAKEPKEIELRFTSGSGINKTQFGIYRLSKGQLEISWGGVGDGKRPTKFSGQVTVGAGKPYSIYRSEDFKEDEAVVKELKRLEGRWMVTPKSDGVIIEGHDMQFLWGGNNKGAHAKFEIDPTKDPLEIEVVYTVGSERYKKRIGIYKLEDDTLTLSLSDFNADTRPTKLAGGDQPGAGKWFSVMKRVKD
jgi:uncharacterized protein (TIGR03067 family)